MTSISRESKPGPLGRVADIVRAVAKRDAAPEDIVAQLRHEGADALQVTVAALAAEARRATKYRDLQQPIDIRVFSQPTPRERAAAIVHQVPLVPFVLNGTLYDPKDVNRFDGQELHFISSRGELIAFDDRNVIARVWEFSYVMPRLDPARITRDSPEGPVPWYWPEIDDGDGTYFYEDSGPGGWGEDLHLRPNRGYWDLRDVGRGFLGAGDWNDVISAFRQEHTGVCVLYEHIHYEGSTLTTLDGFSRDELNSVGWNDRASSVGTW